MTLAPRRRAKTSLFWLALAIIFTHALVPTGSPLRKSSGSAFNPFTAEVALGPKRADQPGKAKQAPALSSDGSGGDLGQVDLPIVLASATILPRPAASVAAQSPPTRSPAGRDGPRAFEARAPPSA